MPSPRGITAARPPFSAGDLAKAILAQPTRRLKALRAVLKASWVALGRFPEPTAPTWPQVGSQDGAKTEKIDAKIDQQIESFQDRCLKRFWMIFGGKRDASWHQNRSKIDAVCETRFFAKSCSPCSGGSKNGVHGVQVGSKNRSKTDQNLKSKMGCLLASIFDAF